MAIGSQEVRTATVAGNKRVAKEGGDISNKSQRGDKCKGAIVRKTDGGSKEVLENG